MTYNRAERRLADNAHGNGHHTGPWNPGDDITRAVYPDPKAAHLNGESVKVQEARELAALDRDQPQAREGDEQPDDTTDDDAPAAKPATKPRTTGKS